MSDAFTPTNEVFLSDLTQEDINRDIANVLNLLRDIEVPLVSFFGSARMAQENPYIQKAEQLAYALGKEGFGILSGGGPGIMRAANTGAHKAGAVSIGLRAQVLEQERVSDDIFTHDLDVKHLLIRRFALSMRSHALVFFPGGFGTLNEIFEYSMLINVGLYEKVPFILIGKEFYDPLIHWLRSEHVQEGTISADAITLFSEEDSIEKIVETIKDFTAHHAIAHDRLPLWKWYEV
jgi:hypothetical protein